MSRNRKIKRVNRNIDQTDSSDGEETKESETMTKFESEKIRQGNA